MADRRIRCPSCSVVFPARGEHADCPNCNFSGRISTRPAAAPASRRRSDNRMVFAVLVVMLLLAAAVTALVVDSGSNPTLPAGNATDGARGTGPGAIPPGGGVPAPEQNTTGDLGTPVGGAGPAGPAPSPITFDGGGDDVTRAFRTQQGLLRVQMDYFGDGFFKATFRNQDDQNVTPRALLAPGEGDYHGSRYLGLLPGNYTLDVTSGDGGSAWRVSIDQPRLVEGLEPPQAADGGGDRASMALQLTPGNHTFHATHAAPKGEFVVRLYDANGNLVRRGDSEALFSTYGDDALFSQVSIPASGIYYVDVQAAGDWTLEARGTG